MRFYVLFQRGVDLIVLFFPGRYNQCCCCWLVLYFTDECHSLSTLYVNRFIVSTQTDHYDVNKTPAFVGNESVITKFRMVVDHKCFS